MVPVLVRVALSRESVVRLVEELQTDNLRPLCATEGIEFPSFVTSGFPDGREVQ
jgi:hypothetical protein